MQKVEVYGDVPLARFGHTMTLVNKTKAVLFGGATGDTGKYIITGDAYSLDLITNTWTKLEGQGIAPTPRAAHASCAVDALQLVVYGGATGGIENNFIVTLIIQIGGSLASDDLYLLDLRNGQNSAQWMIVPVVGETPGRRYGHSLIFNKPHLLVCCGNTGQEPVNDIWCLNVQRSPFQWVKINAPNQSPHARVYHSAALCSSGSATGMMVIFGGRKGDGAALNDTWGLRRHRDGRWDWVQAPYKQTGQAPLQRYQHSSLFMGTMMIVVGGRTNSVNEQVALQLYDTETSEWYKFPSIQRFRHACWAIDGFLYIHGGFQHESPNVPKQYITKLDTFQVFKHAPNIISKLETLFKKNNSPTASGGKMIGGNSATGAASNSSSSSTNLSTGSYSPSNLSGAGGRASPGAGPRNNTPPITQVARDKMGRGADKGGVTIIEHAIVTDATGIRQVVPVHNLNQDNKTALADISVNAGIPAQRKNIENLYTLFLNHLLRPSQWAKNQIDYTDNFPFRREHILALTDQCQSFIQKQPMVLDVKVPVKVFGDIHGQYQDLMRFFDLWGMPDEDGGDIESYDYLFLGDYVDRGSHSLETICLLMALKVKYPQSIHLLRGNHQDKWINNAFGFADQCAARLGQDPSEPNSVFNRINELFDNLPLAAVIQNKIICLHGGIGSTVTDIAQIKSIPRPLEVIHEVSTSQQQLVVDILWSDPTDNDHEVGIQPNFIRDPNGTGNIVKFGPDRVRQFLQNNSLTMILRAHECVMDGFQRFAGGCLITVFSATDYCARHKNAGAVLFITRTLQINPKLIYPLNNPEQNWITDEEPLKKRPPTPPRWTNQNPRRSYDA